MARQKAPRLDKMRCPDDVDVDLERLFKDGKFDPKSDLADDLRNLIAFAAFMQHEHQEAATREEVRKKIGQIVTHTRKLRERLSRLSTSTAPQSAANVLRGKVAKLDVYTCRALAAPTLALHAEDTIDLPELVAALMPASRGARTIDRANAIAALDAFLLTAQLAVDRLRCQSTKRDRLGDKRFVGRSLAALFYQHGDAFEAQGVRWFVASVLEIAEVRHADPEKAARDFYDSLFGHNWLTWRKARVAPSET